MQYPLGKDDWKNFEKNNPRSALNQIQVTLLCPASATASSNYCQSALAVSVTPFFLLE